MNDGIEKDNIQPPRTSADGKTEILTTDTARQGPKGQRVLVVLVCALVLAVVAWIGLQYGV